MLAHRKLATILSLSLAAGTAWSDIDFTQTVDGWWYNKYEWDAQVENINCLRNFDPVGTVKRVWARVVQKNGSKVGTEVFCTTMTKVAAGIVDTWAVDVPAGLIEDEDFWDASRLGIELVECDAHQRRSYNSLPGPYGTLRMHDYAVGALDLEPSTRRVSLDPDLWNDQLVRDHGFDMAVYAYRAFDGLPPQILNHVDELGLSTFNYDQTDAFGSGLPYDPQRLMILGVNLDPTWDTMGNISTGLHMMQWQLFPHGGGTLFTDQGVFQILQAQPLIPGWQSLCTADVNYDGLLNFFDVLLFLQMFSAQNPLADWNGDGFFDFFDVQPYLADFSAGCP
ncbi:MAG: hypothetical protein KJZ65_03825 [Phycisphaerales bacterium]|nr:hypothetical protein [Phycisphaerales bacterium]